MRAPVQEHLLIVVALEEDPRLVEVIRKAHPNVNITWVKSPSRGPGVIPGACVPRDIWQSATILLTDEELPPRPEYAPNLKFIQLHTAGIDQVSKHPMVANSTVKIATVSGIHGPPIAEWVMMSYLTFCRKFYTSYQWQQKHEWHGFGDRMRGIYDNQGKRVGILGYGSVGRHVARVSAALGSSVIAYTMSPRDTPESRRDRGYMVPGTGDPEGVIPEAWFSGKDKASLHEFLSQDLDHLVISVPLTRSTEKFIGPEEFKILARNKTFVTNISRGRVIDQDALIAALHAGDIRGAALDVTDPEPLPVDHPLWDAPNCLVSPHMSFLSEKAFDRIFDILRINLGRLFRGEKLVNQLENSKGY
ncbi:D-isomer specific 2-hydroxyacid dehydrogenase [Xylona heveae TC161]|uniref:D-isomer specific 2-hydroxyacid dehydrogenase n=1 Tax=Xylona heveae (strain CBS 132557 / TC161) TaxID=1328760 RepID=A0A165H6P6_XYLHT|nr:D-isomer specific 2-hydroxyacid dehydrogenase [Xylona heveae TC161]KZF23060.1 D-isomer specific 2-hydroxyacid dehydrogenase [Xylona heveae TC161]